jgi:hypothetical protein
MTNWTAWFRSQLTASADGFIWAYAQIPAAHAEQLPPDPTYLGTWVPARHVWHVTEYERCLAIPAMQVWVQGAPSLQLDWPDDDEAWANVKDRSLETLTAQFHRIRQQQIEMLDRLAHADWTAPQPTGWGPRSLAWVVTKTFQHTYEHGDTLLRMGLWWDIILEEIARQTGKA